MSLARVHNFSISLDGFGTGEGQSHEAPFGHAGQRLHEWMIATRFWGEIVGQPGGSGGVDDAFAQRSHACDFHPCGCLNRLGGVGLHSEREPRRSLDNSRLGVCASRDNRSVEVDVDSPGVPAPDDVALHTRDGTPNPLPSPLPAGASGESPLAFVPSHLRLYRGRYWFRTSDLCRVKAALSR